MLFDIHKGDWDEELLEILGVPRAILPDVLASSGAFGMIAPDGSISFSDRSGLLCRRSGRASSLRSW